MIEVNPRISIDSGIKQIVETGQAVETEKAEKTKRPRTIKKRKNIFTYRHKRTTITYREKGPDGKVHTTTHIRVRRTPEYIIGERLWGVYGTVSIYFDKPIKIKPVPKRKKKNRR